MTRTILLESYCAGGALLGLWALVRFPGRAPSTIPGASVAVLAAFAGAAIIPVLLSAIVNRGGEAGGVVGLVMLVLPALTAIFWSSGCLFRALFGLLGRGA